MAARTDTCTSPGQPRLTGADAGLATRLAEREGHWRNLYADVTNASFAVGRLSIGMTACQGLVSGVQTIVVVYLAARQILAGDGFSVGMLFAFLSYRQTFTDRSVALINQLVQFSYLRLHLARVGDVVQAERESPGVVVELPATVRGGIAARGLSFRYGSGDRLVLDGVDLDIEPGSFVAFTGPSGGGKTTLLKLMLGLYAPTAGDILLDGSAATSGSWPAWRRHAGVVSQEDQLLSGTIADNIAFFDPNLDMRKVQLAAVAARVHEDIARMPMQSCPSSATWARGCPAANGSACCSRERCTGSPRWSSWTKGRRISTRRRKGRSWN